MKAIFSASLEVGLGPDGPNPRLALGLGPRLGAILVLGLGPGLGPGLELGLVGLEVYVEGRMGVGVSAGMGEEWVGRRGGLALGLLGGELVGEMEGGVVLLVSLSVLGRRVGLTVCVGGEGEGEAVGEAEEVENILWLETAREMPPGGDGWVLGW